MISRASSQASLTLYIEKPKADRLEELVQEAVMA